MRPSRFGGACLWSGKDSAGKDGLAKAALCGRRPGPVGSGGGGLFEARECPRKLGRAKALPLRGTKASRGPVAREGRCPVRSRQ